MHRVRSAGRQSGGGVVIFVVLALRAVKGGRRITIRSPESIGGIDLAAIDVLLRGMNDRLPPLSADPRVQPLARQCAICGYDIHDNPAGRCPECGGTLKDRGEWVVKRCRREPRWILAGLGWMVVLSIAAPLLVAALAAIADFLDF
jgi:hypothetical protein